MITYLRFVVANKSLQTFFCIAWKASTKIKMPLMVCLKKLELEDNRGKRREIKSFAILLRTNVVENRRPYGPIYTNSGNPRNPNLNI